VKNHLKNTLSEECVVMLVGFRQIGKVGEGYVMEDAEGNRICLQDMPGMEGTVQRLGMLADGSLFRDKALLGAFFYHEGKRRICVQPYSIVAEGQVVRLLY
jgi:hypothetical protein